VELEMRLRKKMEMERRRKIKVNQGRDGAKYRDKITVLHLRK